MFGYLGSSDTFRRRSVRVRVVGPDGENPALWRAVLRQVMAIALSDTVFGLGYLWILWDSRQQTWHDKIAGTYVVRA